jgi:MFS-type transporter involved in bile tolerance (Atg22 family)
LCWQHHLLSFLWLTLCHPQNRWEFYVQNLLFTLSGSIVNAVFRVLFSELVPKGSEIEWFGLQVVLSCATVRQYQ